MPGAPVDAPFDPLLELEAGSSSWPRPWARIEALARALVFYTVIGTGFGAAIAGALYAFLR